MCFPVLYAGFFAKSQIMFFLTSSFRFCPPLKNDGRVVFVLPWCSDLCTQTCPYRLARLGTSLRVRGEADIKEERNYSFYYFYMSQTKEYWNDSYKKVVLADLNQRERIRTVSRPRTRGRCQRSWRKGQVGAETWNGFNLRPPCPLALHRGYVSSLSVL